MNINSKVYSGGGIALLIILILVIWKIIQGKK